MSVLNHMLRDLEKRGAMPDVVAAAGTATVARPSFVAPKAEVDLRRRWIWAVVFAVAAVFVGIHTWLSYRVESAGVVRQPLGARRFAAIADTARGDQPPRAAQPALPAPASTVLPPMGTDSRPAPEQRGAGTPVSAAASEPGRSSAVVSRPTPKPAAGTTFAQSDTNPDARKARSLSAAATNANAAPAVESAPAPAVVVRYADSVAADVERAADLIARGRSTEAMELLVQVLARQPTHGGARSILAALLAESGHREQALPVLLAGSEQDPLRFAAPAAQLQAELGDLAGALGTLARVPEQDRSAHHDALFAGIAQRAGDHMSAIAAYRRALSQPRPDPVWWVGLGVSLEATGEAPDARSAYARAAAEARLPVDVRRYVSDRLAALGAQEPGSDEAQEGSLANVF